MGRRPHFGSNFASSRMLYVSCNDFTCIVPCFLSGFDLGELADA